MLLPAYICKGCDFLKDKLPVRGIGGSIHSDVLIHKICQLLLQRSHDIAVVEKQTNNSEPSVVSQLLDHQSGAMFVRFEKYWLGCRVSTCFNVIFLLLILGYALAF